MKHAATKPEGLAVDDFPVYCPACGSEKTRVTSTVSPIRYRKCGECGQAFKSIKADHRPISRAEQLQLLKSLRGAVEVLNSAIKVLEI